MPLVYPLPFPLYTGDVDDTNDEVPSVYPVGLAGRAYMLDLASEQFAHQGIDLLKPQTDDTGQVSESSLNPEGLWRRSQDSWHKGAGQTYLDKPDSDSARFRSSIGIDPWTEGELSLLPDTFKTYNVTGGLVGDNLKLVTAGEFVYMGIDTQLFYLTDPLNYITPATTNSVDIQDGEVAQDIASITSDGNYVYCALGLNGIHRTARGTTTAEHYSDLEATLVEYTLGRLMAARQSAIYNVTASGAAPTALYTHPNPDFTWTGFAEGKGHIFAAGYSGDKSIVYKTAIKPDGTALEVPSAAGQLPDGEVVRSIYGYLGFILIGTDNGVRFSVPDSNGNLEIGALIETDSSVRSFEGQGSFVWFGWTNYDNTHTGLGRVDLRTIVGGTAPAHASDLMTSAQGAITSIITFGNRRLFTVAGNGTYVESLNKVSSGTIDSGLISYGIPEDKIAIYVDVRYRTLAGSDAVYLAKRDGVFTLLGTNTALVTSNQFQANSLRSDFLEIRHVFTRDATDTTLGPVLTRHTLKSQVTANMGSYFIVPILIAEEELTLNGDQRHRDVMDEFLFLAGLSTDKSTVTYQFLSQLFTVTVENHEFKMSHLNSDHSGYNGTMFMKLKVVV
jgi:hypothetical protein